MPDAVGLFQRMNDPHSEGNDGLVGNLQLYFTQRAHVHRPVENQANPRLSGLPDEKKAGRVYRLPTEAEWEYACRAGTATVFHHGNTLSSKQANFNGEQPYGGADKGIHIGKPTKVGYYQPNAWGLYDMHGNVWEWCLDGPRDYPKKSLKEPIVDPSGPERVGGSRVLRGGCWNDEAFSCRSARRYPFPPTIRDNYVGFRVVCEQNPAPRPAPKPEVDVRLVANSIGMRLAPIPAGEFAMGSPENEIGRRTSEGPQHRVKITKPFYLGIYEVKQSEYEKVMGKNPSVFNDPDNPVENVIWDETVEFCRKLSELPEEKKVGRVYRLPTEAECRERC